MGVFVFSQAANSDNLRSEQKKAFSHQKLGEKYNWSKELGNLRYENYTT